MSHSLLRKREALSYTAGASQKEALAHALVQHTKREGHDDQETRDEGQRVKLKQNDLTINKKINYNINITQKKYRPIAKR